METKCHSDASMDLVKRKKKEKRKIYSQQPSHLPEPSYISELGEDDP